jgi:hypothetical protein
MAVASALTGTVRIIAHPIPVADVFQAQHGRGPLIGCTDNINTALWPAGSPATVYEAALTALVAVGRSAVAALVAAINLPIAFSPRVEPKISNMLGRRTDKTDKTASPFCQFCRYRLGAFFDFFGSREFQGQ